MQTKPSLRHIIEDNGHDHNFIKVTPEFQEFVAKNLFKHLERYKFVKMYLLYNFKLKFI